MPPGGLHFLSRQEMEERSRAKGRFEQRRPLCNPPPPIRWYVWEFEKRSYRLLPQLLSSAYSAPHYCFHVPEIIFLYCRRVPISAENRCCTIVRACGEFEGAALIAGAINSAPSLPTSLVTFLFGDKKVTHPLLTAVCSLQNSIATFLCITKASCRNCGGWLLIITALLLP